jgi:acyl carrier protein
MELVEKIRSFIESHLTVFDEDVNFSNDDNIFELGFVDSLFAMQLVGFVEEEFKIKVTDQDLDIFNFSSVNRIVSFIKTKMDV